MNVFFDNCTAPLFATTLHGYISHFGHSAAHIKDLEGLPKGRDSEDEEWIKLLTKDVKQWVFVTGDGRVLKNPATRAALRSSGLHGFVLAPAYQKTPLNQLASTLVWKWPEIEKIVTLVEPPAIYEIPVGRGSRLRSLPL